jgi:hypothetical protein
MNINPPRGAGGCEADHARYKRDYRSAAPHCADPLAYNDNYFPPIGLEVLAPNNRDDLYRQ